MISRFNLVLIVNSSFLLFLSHYLHSAISLSHRLKVKVMRTYPKAWQIGCSLFSLLLFNKFQWNLAGLYRVLRPLILFIFRSVCQRSRSQWDKKENVVSARMCLQMPRYSLNNSSIHPIYLLPSRQYIKPNMFNPCPWTFRQRIRLMNLQMSQLSSTADLPVGFPYRFNSSYCTTCVHSHTSLLVKQ